MRKNLLTGFDLERSEDPHFQSGQGFRYPQVCGKENLRTQRPLHTANSSSLGAALRSCSAALRNGAVLPNELDEVVVAVPSDVVTGTVMEKERCPIVVATEIPVLFVVRRVPGIEVRIGY